MKGTENSNVNAIKDGESLVSVDTTTIPENNSKRITSLRFFLAILVVFMHNTFTADIIAKNVKYGGFDTLFCPNKFSVWVQYIISFGLGWCAVPLFFVFAAYLQARKNYSYGTLLKKKVKTLFLPYILWITIYLFYKIFGKIILGKVIPSILANPDKSVFSWGMKDWIAHIIGYGNYLGLNIPDNCPLASGPFWFLRDLMILVLISPVLNYIIKKFPIGTFIFISFLYLTRIPIYFVSEEALFFYSVGLYWGTFNIKLLETIDKISWLEIIIIFLFILVGRRTFLPGRGFKSEMTIISCVLVLKLSAVFIKNEKFFEITKYFSTYSFFLYAIHEPALRYLLQTIWLRFFPMKNAFFCLFECFGVGILIVLIGTAIGIGLRKVCPPLFSLLNGGRN